jgi:hypothetical protein
MALTAPSLAHFTSSFASPSWPCPALDEMLIA